jgi:hypothetical protein
MMWLDERPYTIRFGGIGAYTGPVPDLDDWIAEGRKIPKSKELLEQFLARRDARVDLRQVAFALACIGDSQSVSVLVAALDEPNGDVRKEIAASLGRLDHRARLWGARFTAFRLSMAKPSAARSAEFGLSNSA